MSGDETRYRSEKRPGYLSTSSQPIQLIDNILCLSHSLSLSHSLDRDSSVILPSFVTFRFSFFLFFLFVRLSSPQSRWRVHRKYFPDFAMMILSSIHAIDGRALDVCSGDRGRAVPSTRDNATDRAPLPRRARPRRDFVISLFVHTRGCNYSDSPPRNANEQSLREHLQRPALDVRPRCEGGFPRDVSS